VLAAVVGGGLQGVEAAYLAVKAGWEVVVIDKKPSVPAARLGHLFLREDVTGSDDLFRLLPKVDIVIPALEDEAALLSLDNHCRSAGIPFAFDPAAYAVSSSKIKSDKLFARLGLPAPQPYPEGSYPLIAKPESGSGSKGVTIIHDRSELEALSPDPGSLTGWVVQEYVAGPSYSIEIMGSPGHYTALRVTDLEMDAVFDCKRVTAPTELPTASADRFAEMAVQIAEAISLKGIMDVEVIAHKGDLKVLEIDARLPSQTPIAVYWSSGINMVEALGDLFLKGEMAQSLGNGKSNSRGVVLEHIQVCDGRLEVSGERIMKSGGPLRVYPDFFGADEAISDYAPNQNRWVATLIVSGADREDARTRRNKVIIDIQRHFKLVITNGERVE
jgi:pyrrolysine biosynthesis protein PylC